MTDLLKFQFYLYDSIAGQGLVRTLIFAVDSDTGETKIASRLKDGCSDYINTNFLDEDKNKIENLSTDDLLLSNTKAYIRAHKMLCHYNADYNEKIHADGKPKLRINLHQYVIFTIQGFTQIH